MRRWWMGVMGAGLLAACGPPIDRRDPPDPTPPECAPGECDPPASTSLWPMKVGSTWTYQIEDPFHGSWTKTVRVDQVGAIPGADREGVLFISEQPHLTEHSWQVEEEGLAKRVYEQDVDPRTGQMKRATRWSPLTIKALTAAQSPGWESRVQVIETIEYADGTRDDKDKVFVWRVLEVDVPVTVAGQELKAIKILREREDKDGKDRTYWFVPGVGKVREEGERTEVLSGFQIAR